MSYATMTRDHAIQELRKLPPAHTVHRDDHEALAHRAALVAVIEAGVRDPAYVEQRNKLIPAAERIADAKSGSLRPDMDPLWVRNFLAAMDDLWRQSRGH